MIPADLPRVADIEQRAIPAPWALAQLQEEIDAANSMALVAEDGGSLCGYAFYRVCPPECELLHVVVAPQWRRQNVASSLLRQGFTALSHLGCTDCYLEVRQSNLAARSLYERMGFFQTGTRKQYYHQPDEDALLLSRNLNDGPGES